MKAENTHNLPRPLINRRESETLSVLTEKYNKLTSPTAISKVGKKVSDIIPQPIKNAGVAVKQSISETELFAQCMRVVAEGFNVLEKQAAKTTVNEKTIVKKINAVTNDNEITCLEEICLARSYDVSKLVAKYKTKDLLLALAEGGLTGAFGFPGLPFNLVLSTFIYYRAVQSVAMYYGYDVKNEASELMIASDVFMNALSPSSKGANEVSNIIAKIMVMSETTAVKQTVKKTWADMAARGGVSLLITQMRALANKSAQKALEKAGQKGLEESLFKGVFEQIGKGLSKKAVSRALPVVGAAIGGLFDTAQMNTILEYADIFYNKRFILEKDVRVSILIDDDLGEIINA